MLYHYLYPDDVVSSSHFTELATGLAAAGWRVIASSSNRSCRGNLPPFEKRSFWNGVLFRRVWRPPLRQASGLGRVLNIMWMIAAWSLLALNRRIQPDVLIVGTDPILSPVVATIWKRLRPKTRLVHWCFDLYPEAAVADGLLQERSLIARLCRHLMGRAYRSFGLIVDIGSCMRERLRAYDSRALMETITPWALAEPITPAPVPATERQELFGDANLCLLYSGSFGRAHTWQGLLEIAEAIYPGGGRVVFSAGGTRWRNFGKHWTSLGFRFG